MIETFLWVSCVLVLLRNTKYFDLFYRSSFSGMKRGRERVGEEGKRSWERCSEEAKEQRHLWGERESKAKGQKPSSPLHINATFFRKLATMFLSSGGLPSLHSSHVLDRCSPLQSIDFHVGVYRSTGPFCSCRS